MTAAAQELHDKHKRLAELDVYRELMIRAWLASLPGIIATWAIGDVLNTWVPMITLSTVSVVICISLVITTVVRSCASETLPELWDEDKLKEIERHVMKPISDEVARGERAAVREVGPSWVPNLLQEDSACFVADCPEDRDVYETLRYLGKPTPKGYAVLACLRLRGD